MATTIDTTSPQPTPRVYMTPPRVVRALQVKPPSFKTKDKNVLKTLTEVVERLHGIEAAAAGVGGSAQTGVQAGDATLPDLLFPKTFESQLDLTKPESDVDE